MPSTETDRKMVIVAFDANAALTAVTERSHLIARPAPADHAADYLICGTAATAEQAHQRSTELGGAHVTVGFRYQVGRITGKVLIAERGDQLTAQDVAAIIADGGERPADLEVCTVSDTLDEAEADRDDVSCDQCGAFNDNGEGWDGCCGDCADRLDAAGHWD